jgi:hypothetical protein
MIPLTQENITTLTELSKSQHIRLWDVYFVGPILIYASITGKHSDFVRLSLLLIGLGTIYYNGKNYISNKQKVN